jgi:hypothetical protein
MSGPPNERPPATGAAGASQKSKLGGADRTKTTPNSHESQPPLLRRDAAGNLEILIPGLSRWLHAYELIALFAEADACGFSRGAEQTLTTLLAEALAEEPPR